MSVLLDRPSATAADRELRADLVHRAGELIEMLARNAEQAESERRIPEENLKAIDDAALLSIMRPKRFGGLQVDIRTKLEVSRTLGRGCGSTAWVATLLNVCAWFASLFPEQAQRDVWGSDPGARIVGVFDPSAQTRRVADGFVVTGRWGYASGCLHAQWAELGIPVVDGSGELIDQGFALIPTSDLSIEDTWFVAGMRGTGSNTLIADEIFVPEHRVLSVPKAIAGDYPTPHRDDSLYRSAFVPVAALILVGPILGLAQAALDLVIEKAPRRTITYTTFESQVDAPTVQLAVARAASLVDTAQLHAYRAAADIDEAAYHGEYPEYGARARVRMDTGKAAESAREAIRILMSAHGAGSFAESSSLQRIWRDCETASRHAVIGPEISAQVYGRSLLGRTDEITPLV